MYDDEDEMECLGIESNDRATFAVEKEKRGSHVVFLESTGESGFV